MSKGKEERQKEILSQALTNLEGKPIRIDVRDDEQTPATLKEMLIWICSKTNPQAGAEDLGKTYAVAKKLHGEEVLNAEDIVHLKATIPVFLKNPIIFGVCMDKLDML